MSTPQTTYSAIQANAQSARSAKPEAPKPAAGAVRVRALESGHDGVHFRHKGAVWDWVRPEFDPASGDAGDWFEIVDSSTPLSLGNPHDYADWSATTERI